MPYIKQKEKIQWGEITGLLTNQNDLINFISNLNVNNPISIATKWGEIEGDISNQFDLLNKLNSYSLINHSHNEYINEAPKWGLLEGNINSQADLINLLTDFAPINHKHDEYISNSADIIINFGNHINNTENPHNINKNTIGLSNVINQAQLFRCEKDFYTFPFKELLSDNDILLIEDSENNFSKRKISISQLKSHLNK